MIIHKMLFLYPEMIDMQCANLRKAGSEKDSEIYRLVCDGLVNSYYVVSGTGTRSLMKSPDVVGYDSYLAMVPSTLAALEYLKSEGFRGSTSILTILRGGLNYPLEECCHKAGIQVTDMSFLSCERRIEDGVITGLDIKYDKLDVAADCTLMIGDIIASGITLRLCLQQVVDRFRLNGGSIRRIVFFTIGGTKAISLMEDFTTSIRTAWPEFEGFTCFFYEGIFTVYEDNGVTGVNIPDIDFGWKGGVISPEFRSFILDDPDALFEKCIIYDGGARRYGIPEHCAEVLEYWNALESVADRTDFEKFVAEKIGYAGRPDFKTWLGINHYELLPDMEELYAREQCFLEASSHRSLKEICRKRILEFKRTMNNYIH